jgi:hypothetical protein
MQQAVRIKGVEIVESLFAHPEQIGIEDFDIFERKWDGGEGGKWRRTLRAGAVQIQEIACEGRIMTCTWRERSGGRFCCGKDRAAVQHAAQKITSDHGNILAMNSVSSEQKLIACHCRQV